jgi:hypothetical protein
MRVESGGQANVTAKLRVTNMDWNDIRPAFPTPIANLTDEEIVYSRNRGLNFFDYYMVHAMNGIVAGLTASRGLDWNVEDVLRKAAEVAAVMLIHADAAREKAREEAEHAA